MRFTIEKNRKFCKALRRAAAKMLSEEEYKNLNEFITIDQCVQIVKEKCIGTDNAGRYVVDEDSYINMVVDVAEQMYQSALSKLAAQDIIQCAWDDKENNMIFWADNENGYHAIHNKP